MHRIHGKRRGFPISNKALHPCRASGNIIPQKTTPPVIGKDMCQTIRPIVLLVKVHFPLVMFTRQRTCLVV